jgi:ubiquinone/menaquinone biosynthesis C-methylase UbiE
VPTASTKKTRNTRAERTSRLPLTAEPLHQVMYSFVPSRVMQAALQLGVFSALGKGPQSAARVARATGCSVRGMRMLLDALTACDLANKKHSATRTAYALTPLAGKFLVPASEDYIGAMFEHDTMWATWEELAGAVRSGRPVQRVNDESLRAKFFPVLVRSLHVINREPARRAAAALVAARTRDGKSSAGLRALDLACGSGVWGIALAEADRAAEITALDFETTLTETRKYVARHRVASRFSYQAGDLNQVEFGNGMYDVVFLGHILHIEGERSSRRLLRRVSRSLRPGGRVVIAEMVPNDSRTGPPFPLFFALNMLLNTEMGDTWTLAEYRQWLKQAGFRRIEAVEVGSHSPVIIGTK